MSTLTIAEFQPPLCQFPGETCQLWLWYSQFFVNSDGQPVQWDVANPSQFYQIVDCTILNNVITVPAFDLIVTSNGTPNTSLLTARWVDENGTPREYLFKGWEIPENLEPATTFSSLQQHNRAAFPVNPQSGFLSRQQVEIMIANAISGSGAPKMTTATFGIAELNIPAVDVAAPKVTGSNSPQITGWASVKAIADYANLAAAVSAIGATPSQLLIPSLQTIATGTTIPSTLDVGFTVTGRLSVNSGQTIAINSHPALTPGRQRFFGAGHTRFGTGAANTGVDLGWWAASGDNVTQEFTDAMTSVANTSGGHIRIPTGTYEVTGSTTVVDGVTIEGQGMTYDTSPSVTTVEHVGASTIFRLSEAFRNATFRNFRILGDSEPDSTGVGASGSAPNSAFGLNCENMVFNNLDLGIDIHSNAGSWQVEDINLWNPQFFNCITAALRIDTINSSINSYGGNVSVPALGTGFQFTTVGLTNLFGTKFGGAGTGIVVDGPITSLNFFGIENEGNDFLFKNNNSQLTAATNWIGCVVQSEIKISAAGVYVLIGTSFLGAGAKFTIDAGIAAYVIAINCPGFDAALVDNSAGNAIITKFSGTTVEMARQLTLTDNALSASTPLLNLVSSTVSKILLRLGTSTNYYSASRDTNGFCQWVGSQAIANRRFVFNAPLGISAEIATTPTAPAGQAVIGLNTGHFLQWTANNVATVRNFIGTSTVLTAGKLPIISDAITLEDSTIAKSGSDYTVTGNWNVTGTENVVGNFSVATNKFNVTASNGNTAIAGTLGVTGATALAALTTTTIVASSSVTATKFVATAGLSNVFKGADVPSATALTLTGNVQHVTGTTVITSISTTGILAGTIVVLIFDGVTTLTDGSNLVLAGDFVTSANDSITLVFDGSSFIELCRSVN